ncbi:MAG: hypothetical protein HY290_04635 [Planctomycetia bacterium]|nr:hypothetical protein [Planctomycetia bacterium]
MILSIGPACWIASRTAQEEMPALYRPFERVLLRDGNIGDLLRWYVGVGMPREGRIRFPTNNDFLGSCIYNDETRTGVIGVYLVNGGLFNDVIHSRRGLFGWDRLATVDPPVPPAWTVLRAAGDLARKQDEHQHFWTDRALTLAQMLEQQPADTYAILFKDIIHEEVVQALARAHAASGDADQARAWAEQIGSNGRIQSDEDHETLRAVQQRIFALIGIAEGMLDRTDDSRPK